MKQRGFTLIEAIVATALFAFVVSSILGTYIAVLRLDTRTRAQRAVADDARFLMDFLAKEIRDGHIDYAAYPNQLTCKFSCTDPSFVGTDLHLINQGGEAEHIYYYDITASAVETEPICTPGENICGLYITKGTTTAMLNSSKIKVTRLKFYTYPIGDPFGSTLYSEQPHVRVVMELVANINARDQVKVNLDSTFSTLYYPARP
jgi:prepilin-type N-terminal cleavage/methylation domain-containing protein